ncbi:TonB-dependent siderophore receptor [Hafnia psychrotolerans]|uniref:Ligand-gated channel protein n=1 Tax=Hafnia psychrotolerans TaxID=1477018 RepID=A0ABQ1G2C4_9GAMM|nr:TonB-dependent siderophore receptor [Hafnia psychrotolerans]GGA35267.1 ligand-gated channel protein [Hafnia psychrotolerans]
MSLALPLKRSVLFCAVTLTFPAASLAEEAVVVTSAPVQTADTPTQGYSAKTSRTATKSDQPIITTGQAVSVVTRQQMDDQNATTVNAALNYTPGVFTNFAGGATRYDTISLRGFHGGDVNNTFLDGLRILSDGGSYNAIQVDPWFLERIDVIKGPSSALYGQSIPGGLVMETTKHPQFREEGHFRLSGGTQNTQGGAFDYTNAINDQWAFRLTGMTRSSDTQYDHQREERYAISPQLMWQPDENTSLLLRAYLQKDPSGGYHAAVPADGSLYGNKLSRGFFDGESSLNQFKRWEQIYSYEFRHAFNDMWSFRQNASYTHSNTELDQVYQAGWNADRTLMNRYYSGETSSLDSVAIDNQLEADFATGDLEHNVVVGFDYAYFMNDLKSLAATASTLNPYTGYTGGSDLAYYSNKTGKNRYEQMGTYLQDDMVWNQWHLTLSGRYDTLKTKTAAVDSIALTDVTTERTDRHFNSRASLLYAFENGISPYVSYSQAMTPSALPGPNNTLLKPMQSEQYEAGIKYQPVGTSDLYTAALYDLTQNDVGNRVVVGSYYEPAGKVRSQGLELEAKKQVTERFNVMAGYTYNKVRLEDATENNGNTPYVTPKQMASIWGQYKTPVGVDLGAGVRYIGTQWADNENTQPMPSATLVDASVRMNLAPFNPQLKGAYVQLNANNLFDKKYVAACYGTSYCYWGQERTVVATLGYDF